MTIERNLELQQEAREELEWAEDNRNAEWAFCQRERLIELSEHMAKCVQTEEAA